MKKLFTAVLGFSLILTPIQINADFSEIVFKGCYILGPVTAACGAALTVKSVILLNKERKRKDGGGYSFFPNLGRDLAQAGTIIGVVVTGTGALIWYLAKAVLSK